VLIGMTCLNGLTITAVVIPDNVIPEDVLPEEAIPERAVREGAARHPDMLQDLRDCQALRDAHHWSLWGNLDRCSTFREDLEYWRGNGYEDRRLYLARLHGVPVGSCSVVLPLRENTATAWIEVLAAAPYRRQGIGRLLLEFAEGTSRSRGRRVFDA
jgi:GNAT superfamily N-acetyltransferase